MQATLLHRCNLCVTCHRQPTLTVSTAYTLSWWHRTEHRSDLSDTAPCRVRQHPGIMTKETPMQKRTIAILAASGAVLALAGGPAANAGGLVGSKDIKDNSVRSADI